MSFGGLGLSGINQANKKPTKKCERCELRYSEEEETCIHCGTLNDRELLELKDKVENENLAHSFLGKKFIAVALVLFFILVFSFQ